MNIKAIFFDIDGTLVPFTTHTISAATREALLELRRKGIKLFIATGRPKLLINNLQDIYFDGYVTLNGAHCFLPDGTLLYKATIPTEDIDRLMEHHHSDPFPIVFVNEDSWFITERNSDVDEVSRILEVNIPPILPIEEVKQREILQMMGYFGKEKDAYIFGKVLKHCEEMRWHPLFTDIISHGNSKSHGIERMIQHFGIARDEIMAIGDGGNDIQMLEYAGLGVAMGNAEPHVKKHADFVTKSVEEEGICYALRHFGLID